MVTGPVVRGVGYPLPPSVYLPVSKDAAVTPDQQASQAAARSYTRKGYRCITYALDNARNNEKLDVSGNYIVAVNSTTDAWIEIRIGDPFNDKVPFTKGFGLGGMPFDALWLTHDAQASGTITLLIGSDAPGDEVSAL